VGAKKQKQFIHHRIPILKVKNIGTKLVIANYKQIKDHNFVSMPKATFGYVP